MPSRRRFAFLPLLATLAAFLLPSSSAWAQNVTFPFFGGGEGNATTSLLMAFNYQWKFFGAIAGTAGGTANALYYMAITATLVGAILIVVNKKYQDPVTIGTWFMLVLVMVFAPYNSQLLFYPLNTVQNANNSAAGGNPPAASSGGPCTPGSSNNICGFTPQVVAAHLGSTLALMIYDVFQKDGLQSLSQQINSQNAFHNDPTMQAKDIKPKWDEYTGRCGKQSPTPPVVPAAMNGRATNSNTSATPSTIPFEDALRSISKNMRSSDHSAPIAIAIPKFSSPDEAGGEQQWAKYTNGINALRAKFLGQTNALTSNGDYPAAVDAIQQAIASQPQASSNPMLNLSSYITAAPAGGGTLQDSDPTMQARMQFFVNKNGVQSDYGEQLGDSTKEDKINKGSARFLSTLAGDPAIASMPVEQVVYDVNRTSCVTDCPVNATNLSLNLGTCLRQSGMALTGNCSGTVAAAVGAKDDCVAKADILFKEAIRGMAANNYANYQPLLDLLNDTSTPNFSPTLTATDICKSLTDSSQPCSNAENILTYIKSNPDAQNKAMFATALGQNIIRNSSNGGTPGTDTASTSTNDPTGNSYIARAWNGVKQYLSGGIADLGLALAGGIGYFIGNVMGNAILAIVKVLAQVALMGIIIMTPFVFIMGLLIPSNAAGMLIVTTIAVFVLKFYPATIAIIDYTIGTINSAQWAANGTGLMGISLQGLLMLVEGMLAAKVLSLTFWIMFKMGDTNNLRAITNLESAAGEIADAGAAAMAAVAAVAGTAVVGGAAAAMQGKSFGAGGAKAMGNKLLNTAKGMAGKAGIETPTAAEAKGEVPEAPEGQLGEVIPHGPTPDERSADDWQKSAEDDLKKAQESKTAFDGMMPEIQPGGEDDMLHAGWISAVHMDKPGKADSSGGEAEGTASADEKAEEAVGAAEKSPSLPEGVEEMPNGNLKAGGQVYEDGNWRKNKTTGQYEVRRSSGMGFMGRDPNSTFIPLNQAVAEDSQFQPGGMSTQVRGVPLGGGAAGGANVNGEFGGALAAGDVNLQNVQATATAGGASGNGQSVGSTSSSTPAGAPTVATAGGGAGGTPPGAPTSSSAPASGGGEQNLRVGRMEVAQANMPANAAAQQQGATIKPNDDDAEWLSKSWGERFLRGAWSGAVGSIAATGQLSKVPGIGQIMRVVGEVANEGTEAPIRARAFWKAGKARKNEGYSGLSYWKAMKDQSALRMYQQREGVLAGAAAFNTLKDNGHLMSGWDNASNAAIQVAARQMADQVKRAIHEADPKFGKMTAEKYFTNNMVGSLSPDLGVEYANFQFKQGSFNAAEIKPVFDTAGKPVMLPPDKDGIVRQKFETVKEHTGLESVTFLQRRAALESSVDAPMNLQKINSLHERKLWDRRNDIKKSQAIIAQNEADLSSTNATTVAKAKAYKESEQYKYDTIFANMNEAEAFVADEMHHFKPQHYRNHREKAYIFIAQKVAESKNRAIDASYDGIQEIMEGWQHDVARRKVEVSADGRAAAQLASDVQVKAKKLEISAAGRRATKLAADINLKNAKLEISDKGYKLAVQHGAQKIHDTRGQISDLGREIDKEDYNLKRTLKKFRASEIGRQEARAEAVEKVGGQLYNAGASLGMPAQKALTGYYLGTRFSLDNAAVQAVRLLTGEGVRLDRAQAMLGRMMVNSKDKGNFMSSIRAGKDKPATDNKQVFGKEVLELARKELENAKKTKNVADEKAANELVKILEKKQAEGKTVNGEFIMDEITVKSTK
jgi:hypothetical protein